MHVTGSANYIFSIILFDEIQQFYNVLKNLPQSKTISLCTFSLIGALSLIIAIIVYAPCKN